MAHVTTGPQLALTMLQERSAGTFAKVYLAEARGTDGLSRIVAVKVLKEQWLESEELIRRTRDEAMLLARLRHKNILRVEAMTEIDQRPAIVMEFVDGVDLGQLIEAKDGAITAFPPRAAYRIAMETASALHAAWARVPYGLSEPLQVVHRDIKPPNIMISIEGEVKVLDFGTARFTHDQRIAKTGVMRFGSMKYMSPERRKGARGEHSCDIYSLGLVLIEMLQGQMLPLLPIDIQEHDEALGEIIAELNNLGLPDPAWEDSFRQALSCICASSPESRLSAEQVIELMRAFTENADGESLDAYAHRRVSRVAQVVFGQAGSGDLTGSQVFVRLDGPEGGLKEAPAPQEWTGPAAQIAPLPEPEIQAPLQPEPPVYEPVRERREKKHPVVLMTMILLPIFLLGAIGVGFLAQEYFEKERKKSSRSDDDDQERKSSSETESVGLKVTLNTPGSEIQYIGLDDFNSEEPLLRARPESDARQGPLVMEGEVPSGDLQLSVKLRYRDEVVTILTLEEALVLDCQPSADDEAQIICRDEGGLLFTLQGERPPG